MDLIKLSVIIPVYNVEKFLSECVDNIYNQGLKIEDFEIILINDGSTDNSFKICEAYDLKYQNIKIIDQPNLGVSVARNKGIQESCGEYLYFIDSDDFLQQNVLSAILNTMITNKLDFFGFYMEQTSRRNIDKPFEGDFSVTFRGTGLAILNKFNFNNGPCWYVFRRELISDLRFVEGRLCEDGLFTPRLIMNVKNAQIVSDKLYFYYLNESSTVNNKNIKKNTKLMDDMFFAIVDYDNILKSLPVNNMEAFKKLRARQETYLFFGIVRFLKLKRPTIELFNKIAELKFTKYKVYPINAFKGYNRRDKVLIFIMNRKWSLCMLHLVNKKLQIIK